MHSDNNESDLEFVHACHANKVSNNEVIKDLIFVKSLDIMKY